MELGSEDSTESKTNPVSALRELILYEGRQTMCTKHINQIILAFGKVTRKTDREGGSRPAGVGFLGKVVRKDLRN